jgi:hypothetical protein
MSGWAFVLLILGYVYVQKIPKKKLSNDELNDLLPDCEFSQPKEIDT